jgi:hypothetical protein
MHCSKSTGTLLLLLGTIVVRLPLLMSPSLIPDLDEAALAIQVQKWLEGISVQSFFPGQTHNWVGLEMLMIAPGLLLFSPSVFSLKLPMLVLFSASVLLLYHSGVKHLRPLPFALLLFIVTSMPPLLVWSMKLRGGYVPAFFFMSLTLFVLSRNRVWPVQMVFVGLFVSLMLQSHLLCAVFALMPIIALYKRENISVWYMLFAVLGGIIGWMITRVGKTPKPLYPADTSRFADDFSVFSAPIFSDMWQFMSGQFLFWQTSGPSLIFLGAPLLVLALIGFLFFGRGRIYIALLVSGFLLFYWLFQPFPLRYGIPFLFALIGMVAVFSPQVRGHWLIIPALYLGSLPFISPFYHTHLQHDDGVRLEDELRRWASEHSDFATVFCEDESMAYILNFYSNVHYRSKLAYSRFQRDWYDAELALRDGKRVALISQRPILNGINGTSIGMTFYIYDTIDQSVLKNLGFELKE